MGVKAVWRGNCVKIDMNISVLSHCLLFIYLFGVLGRFQHCTGHITTGSWKGRGNQYIQFVRVLYCKLPTNGKQLPAFPLEAVPGTEPRPQRWEARVLPLCHRGPHCLLYINPSVSLTSSIIFEMPSCWVFTELFLCIFIYWCVYLSTLPLPFGSLCSSVRLPVCLTQKTTNQI